MPAAARYSAERRAETARADQQHAGLLQLQLPFHADFGHDQVPAVAEDFVFRQTYFVRHGVHLQSRATRNARNNGKRIRIVHRRRVLVHVADIFVVQIDIDETAQLAFVVVEMLLQIREARGQRGQHFADGLAGEIDGIVLVGELPQRGRDQDSGHISSSFSAWVCSAFGSQLLAWSKRPF